MLLIYVTISSIEFWENIWNLPEMFQYFQQNFNSHWKIVMLLKTLPGIEVVWTISKGYYKVYLKSLSENLFYNGFLLN